MTEPQTRTRTTRTSSHAAAEPAPAHPPAARPAPGAAARTRASLPRRSLPARRLLFILATAVLLTAGAAFAQDTSRTADDPGGHVPTFEVVERTNTDQLGATIHVDVEVDGLQTPTIVLVGPGGTIVDATGTDQTFPSVPQGHYLVAATAPQMRVASGTLAAGDGDEIRVALRLFQQRMNYADESDTPILGLFTMDISDNDEDERGAIELNFTPGGAFAAIGSDGYVVTDITEEESRVLESLEPGRYVIGATLESYDLATTTVALGAGQRVTLDVELETVRP